MCITNNPDHFLIRADFLFEKKGGKPAYVWIVQCIQNNFSL
jgi:hypothetical protein